MNRSAPFAALLVAALSAFPATPADAGIRLRSLLGEAPPDSEHVAETRFEGLDSLTVARQADRGLFHYEEQVERFAGGDAARLGVEGVTRPHSFGVAGAGRLPLTLDGFPIGRGHASWGAPGWFPSRALSRIGVQSGPAAGGEGGGAHVLAAETRPGPERPASIVALGGGDFGHRLAELDFARRFGNVGFHADVADFGHDGFGTIGRIDGARGFARFDFTAFGFDALLDAGLSSGEMTALDANLDTGTEMTDDAFFGLRLTRPWGAGALELRLLRESNHYRLESFSTVGFEVERGRWWAEGARTFRAGSGDWRASLAAALETSGGLRADTDFAGVEAALGHERPLGGAHLAAELRLARREPAGWQIEPSARLSGGSPAARWWLALARTTGTPGLLLHVDAALPNAEAVSRILERLETIEAPEAYESAVLGVAAGERFRLGLEGSVARGTNVQPWLAAGAFDRPLTAADPERWTAAARLMARWQARRDLTFGLTGGVASFDATEEPYRPRGRADGYARLRRVYFEGDLDLSGSLTGTLLLARRDPSGLEYPTVFVPGALLTAQIRTLTLYFRIENMAAILVESDLRESDFAVALPGWHGRIGATLRLLD
jgi:hypothetical protein